MNSKTKGNISEAIILAFLLKSGHSVSIPFGNNSRYDMILDNGKTLSKIQCKTGRLVNGCVVFKTTSTNGFTGKKTNYINDIDFFIVYCPELNSIYKIHVSEAPTGGNMHLRVEAPKTSYFISTINWAYNYKIN